jgi:hypothetical protein
MRRRLEVDGLVNALDTVTHPEEAVDMERG